ncbi:MAG: methyltransferase domain-containing protein [Thermodesulfovibrionales bacterium]|nr:methyltransferase domain-containing protein [Thermodesulfovibrionales bacterium]
MENSGTTHYATNRKFSRTPCSIEVDYSVFSNDAKQRRLIDLKANAIDMSEAGIGIQIDYPLTPGNIVWFNSGIVEKVGYVRWCTQADNGYRAGVELDGKYVVQLDEATEVFNKRLEVLEKRCLDPDENPEGLLQATQEAIDEVLLSCAKFEQQVHDKDVIRSTRIRFREKTNPLLSKSYFINRARTWPQGYQGDFKMLESAYRNSPLSESLGYYLDLYCLNTSLAVAVSNRLKKLESILKEELSKRSRPSVLNIASGSCREVFELAPEIERSGATFTCIDFDQDSLSFAANRLSYTNISPLTSHQVKLRKYNALRMFDHELNMSEFGKQDIIYSVGFFDYLDSEFLARLFKAMYTLLNPGGLLITSFKDAKRYRYHDYHWIVDWDGFLQRTEKDFFQIFSDADIPESSITEKREDSGVIVFYLVAP